MGRRASLADRPGGPKEHPVSETEIKAMAALVRDAVAKGAVGFSTSRLLVHRDPTGALTPGALAGVAEVEAICDAIAAGGGGCFEMSTDWMSYDDVAYSKLDRKLVRSYQQREAGWMVDAARKHGPKISFTYNAFPGPVSVGANAIAEINKAGGFALGQTFVRIQGFLFAFGARMNPFNVSRTYRKLAQACEASGTDIFAELRRPATREAILREAARLFGKTKGDGVRISAGMRELIKLFTPFKNVFIWQGSYEPEREAHSVAARAAAAGQAPWEWMYDFLLGGGVLWKAQPGLYHHGNMDGNHEFLQRDDMIPGFADSGAHGTMMQDATASTHTLTHWVRDRTQGNARKFPIEVIVKKQTSDVARLFGLGGSVGTLLPGMKANLNVINMDELKIHQPRLTRDWMRRWVQDVDGYELTMCGGEITYLHGEPTGALPGGLMRNPNADASKYRAVAWKVSSAFDGEIAEFDITDENGDGVHDQAMDSMGDKGGSAAARLLRGLEEEDTAMPRARL